MTKLSVNVDKITTFRSVHDGDTPNVVLAARRCQELGAEGITVHPKPNERHITYQDVKDLREVVAIEFSIEGCPSDSFLDLVRSVCPKQVTLTPDKSDVLTSDSGQAVADCRDLLKPIVERPKQTGMRVSPSIGADPQHIEAAAEISADRVELYTGPYALQMTQSDDLKVIVTPFTETAQVAQCVGLGANAGHDLNRDSLTYFVQHVTPPDEVSIGHALISDTLYLSLEEVIAQYPKQAHSNS